MVARTADIEFARPRRRLCRVGIWHRTSWHFGFSGVETVLKAEGWIKTLTFIVLSPLIGMALGFILMVAVYWIFHRVSVTRVDRVFRVGQLFSAAAYSLGHGGNDAQKTMGIITIVLVVGRISADDARR